MIATDPLSLMFISCFVVGLLFLLITAFTGHGHGHALAHHTGVTSHIGHGGPAHVLHAAGGTHATPHTGQSASHTTNQHTHGSHFSLLSIVNPLNIAIFLLGFGFFGYLLHAATGFALPLIFVLACIGGLAIAASLIIMLNRIFGSATGTTIQDVSDRTGLLGKVNTTIPQMGLGEIIYTSPGGMRKSVPARSIDGRRLEREQEVVVVNYNGGVAEVDTWDHFINQEGTSSE
jgi:hypothetical protein